MARVLVVDDEKGMREFLAILLRQTGHEVVTSKDGLDAVQLIKDGGFDLVITDLKLPGVDGIEVLKVSRKFMPTTQVIMITAYATTENAIEAMKQGAYDYILKPFKVEEIKVVVEKAMEKGRLLTENIRLRERIRGTFSLEGIIGKSRGMQEVFSLILKVADTRANVLVTGESGTGKELVARAIHASGPRATKPFVVVNCAAIPETLMESELFGHVKGAFTGAVVDKEGLFEAAKGGTVFLDEVAEIPLLLQVKLLRVLQDHMVRRVGGVEDAQIDVRVVAATNKDLAAQVAAGRFREDLFYRLNVIQVQLPPLRERREDIPLLARHFLRTFCAEQGKMIEDFAREATEALLEFPWAGNVRQLENIIERAVTLTTGAKIALDAFPPELRNAAAGAIPGAGPDGAIGRRGGVNFDDEVALFEKKLILRALEEAQGDRQRAADLLGLTMRSLRYRLAKYNLDAD